MIQHVAKDGKLPLTVVRAGKTLKIELPVSAEHPTLVADLHGELSVVLHLRTAGVFDAPPGSSWSQLRKQRRTDARAWAP